MPEDARPSVTEALRAAILAGEYAPRQRLIEIDLCERFETSRFILRAALQDLSGQGLVEFQRNRGARVRDVSLAEAIEITEVRILLEGHLAERAAERVTRSDTAVLRQTIRDMRAQFSLSLVPGRPAVSLPQHAAIVAAITARKPEEARKAMHDHLQSVIQAFQALPVAAARR